MGMGQDLPAIPSAQEKLTQAEQILGWSVMERCQGDEAELSQTQYTQPCLYVIESILSDLLKGQGASPAYVAGHSLGEYSALYAVGVFDFATGLQLVKQRAELMSQAQGGKMAALMKFDPAQLLELLATTPDVVLANDNSAEQVVISGKPEAVDSILAQVKAKRAVPLKVSGAFHSPFMAGAAQQFQAILENTPFQDAQVPVLSNVDPTPTQAGDILKQRLIRQMTGSVRWQEIMQALPPLGVTSVWEVGPGKVLTGLFKRTCPDLELKNISGPADLAE
ncbi:malonyl CoA-acyl carrier protein transacylase [Synechocystis sp. LKSZ1]